MNDTQVLRSMQSFMQASRQVRQLCRNEGVFIVLDDDENIATLVANLISRRGKPVRIAGSVMAGKLAVEELGSEGVACIVVDYQLPNGTGVDFVNWLSEKFPGVPYLFYTANPGAVNKGLPQHLHEVCVIKKTESMSVLMGAIGV